MRARSIIERMVVVPEIQQQVDALSKEYDAMARVLDNKIKEAGGHSALISAGADLYQSDPEYKQAYDRMMAIHDERQALRKKLYRRRQVVGNYLRFGELPTTRSRNAAKAKNDPTRFEAGISVYPAIWNEKHKAWLLDDNEIYENHTAADSCVCDFEDGKLKCYLIKGTEIYGEVGSDGEPLLDRRALKVVKELDTIVWDGSVFRFNENNRELGPEERVDTLQRAGFENDSIVAALIRGGMPEDEANALVSKVAES